MQPQLHVIKDSSHESIEDLFKLVDEATKSDLPIVTIIGHGQGRKISVTSRDLFTSATVYATILTKVGDIAEIKKQSDTTWIISLKNDATMESIVDQKVIPITTATELENKLVKLKLFGDRFIKTFGVCTDENQVPYVKIHARTPDYKNQIVNALYDAGYGVNIKSDPTWMSYFRFYFNETSAAEKSVSPKLVKMKPDSKDGDSAATPTVPDRTIKVVDDFESSLGSLEQVCALPPLEIMNDFNRAIESEYGTGAFVVVDGDGGESLPLDTSDFTFMLSEE